MVWKSVSKERFLYRRGTVFYVRRRVPKGLRAVIGQEFFIRALKTSDEREARRLALFANATFQQRLDEAAGRTGVAQLQGVKLDDMDIGLIEDMVSRWFAAGYRAAALAFVADGEDEASQETSERRRALVRDAALLNIPAHPSHESILGPVISHLIRSEGLEFRHRDLGGGIVLKSVPEVVADRTGLKYRLFTDLLRRGMLELINQEISQLAQIAATVVDPDMRAAIDGSRSKRRIRLCELIDEFRNDPSKLKSTTKIKLDYGFVFRVIQEVVGPDRCIDEISREHCKAVRALLMRMPSNASKIYPNLTLGEAADQAKVDGRPMLSPTTIKSHLHKMSSLFKFAVDEELLDRNPARALAPRGVRHSKSDRLTFSADQLARIFSAPVFQGSQDSERGWSKVGQTRGTGARYWVPIIGLLQGMRLNEICQLRTADVGFEDGIAFLRVETLDDEDEDRRTKTAASSRSIPVHSLAIELGFLKYLETTKEGGHSRLFPELTLDARGYYSDAFQKWFSRLLVKQGARRARTSFHSFRHAWKQALLEANVHGERIRIIGGWQELDTSETYGSELSVKEAKAEIEKVQFPAVGQLLREAFR